MKLTEVRLSGYFRSIYCDDFDGKIGLFAQLMVQRRPTTTTVQLRINSI
jgi:hypothetical protein